MSAFAISTWFAPSDEGEDREDGNDEDEGYSE
jgi:hypothetical protein